MTGETPRPGRLLDRPGRVAAIGGAAVVCALSLSGALGLSSTGSSADASRHQTTSSGHPASFRSDLAAGKSDTATGGGGSAGSSGSSGSSGSNGHADQGGPADGGGGSAAPGRTDPPAANEVSHPAPSAALPAHSGTGKRIVFDVSAQRVWLVDPDDSVERTYLVSGSTFDNLDLATYSVYSRSSEATAYNSNETMRYMVRFAQGNTAPIGFHSIPARPDGTLVETRSTLGTPQSDGCIRQWITDAKALWDFAPLGTTVVVRA